METREEIAPMLSKYRTEYHALFAQLVSMAEGMGERKKSNFFVFFELLWWRKTIIQRNDFSRKAEFPWSQGFTKIEEKNSKRLFCAFHSFYEPNLVLYFLCPKLLLIADYLSINFALFTQLLFYSNWCTYWKPS